MSGETTVLLDGLTFPEGPRWHDGALWFSDFYSRRVIRLGCDGRAETIARVEGQPSGLGWLPDGRLLVVSMTDRRLLRLDPDGLVMVADLAALAPFNCNDMVVDDQGRAYVGNFGFDLANRQKAAATGLILVTGSGQARIVADQLMFPNGCVITDDGRTLVVAETFARRLTAFDIADDGGLHGRRIWASFAEIAPDGICLDAEGAIWVASPLTLEVLRVEQGGGLVQRVAIDQAPLACALGGEDGATLFILSAASATASAETALAALGGRVDWIKVSVPAQGMRSSADRQNEKPAA